MSIPAAQVFFAARVPTDWKGGNQPGDLDDALDQLAAQRVTGPSSAKDNAVPRYDGTTGKLIQDSGLVVNDSDVVSGVTLVDAVVSSGNVTQHEGNIDHDALTNYAADQHKTVISVRKSSDETISSDDTLSDDSELTVSVAANTNYIVLAQINYTSGSTPDFKYALTIPAGATMGIAGYAIRGVGAVLRDGQYITSSGSAVTVAGNGVEMLTLQGTIKIGGTAGSLTFQWAQNTSDASNTTVYEGSFLRVEVI